jgi:hypothetical protein
VIIDGPGKLADAPEKAVAGSRKRDALGDDEIVAFTNMCEAVNDVPQAIRENKPTGMHLDLYNTIMDFVGFSEDAHIAALSHLVDYMAEGNNFVGMVPPHGIRWLRTYMAKNY